MIPLICGGVLLLVTAYWLGGRLAAAGEAVRSNEVRHRAVVEAMMDAHLITDWQGSVRACNPAAEEIFGWQAADIVGQSITLLLKDVGSQRTRDWTVRGAATTALVSTPRRWVYPDAGRRKDGSLFPIEISVSPFQASGEQLFSCVIRDLSDRWAFEARLHRLDAAIDQAGDAISLLGPDRCIEYVNPQFERQTGYAREEVIGRKLPRGASDPAVYADLWATVDQGRTWTGQVCSRRRDGSLCNEDVSFTPIVDGQGAIKGYVAVMRDITRRLAADLERRRLAEALRHCTDSIEILDSQGRIVYVNAAFEASSGQRLADIRGSRPEALMDFGADADSYDDMMRTAYRGGRPWSGPLKALTPDGRIREEEVTVSPMRDDRGQISGYVVVKRDTTDRRRLEAQARQKQKLANIGQLADGIAQELNAPMQRFDDHLKLLRHAFDGLDRLLVELSAFGAGSTPVPPAAIRGCLQSADVDFLRREITLALNQSGEGAGRIAGILRALREIADTRAEKTDVDLNRMLQSTIIVTTSEWQPVAEISTDFDAGLPPVKCLPGEIGLVLFNMLVQSAQAVAAVNRTGLRGKGVIAVATKRYDDWAEIRIGSTGKDITPELRQKLFAPAPGDSSDAQGQDLALAHDIVVRRHHGTIGLESEPGRGATFIIRIPIEAAVDAAATAAA